MFLTLNFSEEKSHLPSVSLQNTNPNRFGDLFDSQKPISNQQSGCVRKVKPFRKSLCIQNYALDLGSRPPASFREESAKQLQDLMKKAIKKRKLNNENHSEYLRNLRQKTVSDKSIIVFCERLRKYQRRT